MTEQLTVGRLDSKVKTVVEEATEYDRWKYVLLLVVLFFFFFLRPRTRAKPMRSVRCVEFVIGRIERWIVGIRVFAIPIHTVPIPEHQCARICTRRVGFLLLTRDHT